MPANASLSRFPGETAYFDIAYAVGGTPQNLESGGTLAFRLHGQKQKDYPAVVTVEYRDGGLTARARFTAAVTELMKVGTYLLYPYWTPTGGEESDAIAVCELIIKPVLPI